MAILPTKELLNGTKEPDTTTGEFRVAIGNLQEYLSDLLGQDSRDKWAARQTLGAAEKLMAEVEGTENALVVHLDTPLAQPVHGMQLIIRARTANTASAPTLKVDDTSALPVVKGSDQPLLPGDIAGAGHWIEVRYDLFLNKWVLTNPATDVSLKKETDRLENSKADKTQLANYLPLSGGVLGGTLTVPSVFAIQSQDAGIEGGEMYLKGAGYYEDIVIDNNSGKFRVFGGKNNQKTLSYDPSTGTLSCDAVSASINGMSDCLVQQWMSGTGFYRKYRSGWVEQGGSMQGLGQGNTVVNYFVPVNPFYISMVESRGNWGDRAFKYVYDVTTVSATFGHDAGGFYWMIGGQGV